MAETLCCERGPAGSRSLHSEEKFPRSKPWRSPHEQTRACEGCDALPHPHQKFGADLEVPWSLQARQVVANAVATRWVLDLFSNQLAE